MDGFPMTMDMLVRRRFAELARGLETRCVGGIDRPHRWKPHEVIDVETGFGMTDPEAWACVARWLEDTSLPLKSAELRQPKGAVGYVLNVNMKHLDRRVYVKFEFIIIAERNFICGRSFHLEDPR